MKLNTLFLIPFLILSIKTKINWDSYSIETFINYEKKKGLFEIIKSIKMIYGQDVAIITCEELNKNYNGNCQRLVTEYMTEPSDIIISKGPKPTREYLKCIEEFYYSLITNQSYQDSDIKRELQNKFNEAQIKLIYKKIMRRVKKLEVCKE